MARLTCNWEQGWLVLQAFGLSDCQLDHVWAGGRAGDHEQIDSDSDVAEAHSGAT